MNYVKKGLRLSGTLILIFSLSGCHSRRDWSEIFTRKGMEYMKKGKLDLSEIEFEKAMRIDRSNRQVFLESAKLSQKKGKIKFVIEALNTAEALGPLDARYHVMRGDAEVLDGQYLYAIKNDYAEALKLEPENNEYALKRAHALEMVESSKITDSSVKSKNL